jgi:hypothetical protein
MTCGGGSTIFPVPSAIKIPEFRGILGDCTQLAEHLSDYIRAAR